MITVVSGLPRSGTSLMMQMLAAGGMPVLTDGVREADQSNPRGYLEFEPVKHSAKDSAWVASAAGKAVKVVYALLRYLPAPYEYRVILMHREIAEVIASQQAMLDSSQRKGADASPTQLQAIFERDLRSTEAWLADQRNFSMLTVNYANCVNDPGGAAAAVANFLAPLRELNRERMAESVDVSLYRQRQSG